MANSIEFLNKPREVIREVRPSQCGRLKGMVSESGSGQNQDLGVLSSHLH
jgi:hypothetical protein